MKSRQQSGMKQRRFIIKNEQQNSLKNRQQFSMLKRLIACLAVVFLLFSYPPVLDSSAAFATSLPAISAAAAVVLDGETGAILYEHDAFSLRAPASTTKILTALLAIECGQLDDTVAVSKKAAQVGEATVYLCPNDRLLLRELLYGALLQSGNDACVAIAEHIAGSEEEFVALMNLKARAIGAYQSYFCNTNGLPHPQHLTTAYDLAQITRHALHNPVFGQIVRTRTHVMQWMEPTKSRYLKNTNQLLWSYPYATGVKTGTTVQAGKCLVASAQYGPHEIIAVVLHSANRFGDAQKLLDYGIRVKETQRNAKANPNG